MEIHEDMSFGRRLHNQYSVRTQESALGPLFAMGLMKGARANQQDLVKEAKKHQNFLNALRAGKVAEALCAPSEPGCWEV